MNIIKDNRNSNAIYVDKANNHVANTDEIIRFRCAKYMSTIDKYIAIVTGGLSFNNTEIAVLKHIINNNGTKLSGELCIAVAKEVNKSTATVVRAINTLRDEGFIYGDGSNIIKLSSAIAANIEDINKANFFVIEVNPDVTSKHIDI